MVLTLTPFFEEGEPSKNDLLCQFMFHFFSKKLYQVTSNG